MTAVKEFENVQAQDLMTQQPVYIDGQALLHEAIAMMQEEKITAVPVVDGKSRPIGVLSQTDIVRHLYENSEYPLMDVDFFEQDFPENDMIEFKIDASEDVHVLDVMTPLVFSVGPDAPITVLIEEILTRKVHRMFVVDTAGCLAGVISTLDILKHVQDLYLKL